jgi:predicted Zn-dependent protease
MTLKLVVFLDKTVHHGNDIENEFFPFERQWAYLIKKGYIHSEKNLKVNSTGLLKA